MNADVTHFYALLAGVISFLSPCVLPLVPPYLCYMAGVSLDSLTGKGPVSDLANSKAGDPGSNSIRNQALLHALLFVAGFSLVFTALGAGASTIGQILRAHLDILSWIAGIIIIIMGFHFLGLFRIALLYREARFNTKAVGVAGSFLMGIAFAFGWTPCIGPILGSILAIASSRSTATDGALLLATYSAGLGIPFLLAAFFASPFISFLHRFKKHLETVEKLTGVLLILTGILFITGGMQSASFWLLETFPFLGAIG